MPSDPPAYNKPTAARVRFYNRVRRLRPIQLGEFLKKLFRIRRFHYRLEDGRIYWIDPVSNLGLFLLNEGHYEPEMERVLREVLRPGDTFIDVGANEGYFTILAAKLVGERGRVHAAEPQSRLEAVLRANVEANAAEGLVSIHRLGLAAEEGEAVLHLTPDVNTGASSLTRHWRIGSRTETIRTVPLDALAESEGIESLRLLKIDCEGAEIGVLAGASRLLSQRAAEHILIEYHPHIIGEDTCKRLAEQILGYGYRQIPCGKFHLYKGT